MDTSYQFLDKRPSAIPYWTQLIYFRKEYQLCLHGFVGLG